MKDHRTIVIADHHKSVFVCQVLDRVTLPGFGGHGVR